MVKKKVNRIQVNMHEAKTRLSQLAELVWQGEEVVIAKSGKPYLDLKPHQPRTAERKPGRYKGQIKLDDSFNTLPQDVLDTFEGEV
jgi:antitoxin (DNA-binding transcriptional repressor) of toxin-antitoxin stability system